MKNSIKGTVAAMVVSMGVFGSAMTVCAAPADEFTLYTTQKTFECSEGGEVHEITDEEIQQLRENLEMDAYGLTDEEKEIYKESRKYMRKECEKVGDFFEDIINFFS